MEPGRLGPTVSSRVYDWVTVTINQLFISIDPVTWAGQARTAIERSRRPTLGNSELPDKLTAHSELNSQKYTLQIQSPVCNFYSNVDSTNEASRERGVVGVTGSDQLLTCNQSLHTCKDQRS